MTDLNFNITDINKFKDLITKNIKKVKDSLDDNLYTRTYNINRKKIIKNGKIFWRFPIPTSGDLIYSWNFIANINGGRINPSLKMFVNNELIDSVKGIYSNNIQLYEVRSSIKQIEIPKTKRDNRLINFERITYQQQIDCIKMFIKDKNLKEYPKDILDKTLWLGGINI